MVVKEIRQALADDRLTDVESIDARNTQSDSYAGIEIKFYGRWINIRTIIDAVAESEDYAIETLHFADDGEAYLCVFLARVPEIRHPAFVE